MKIVVADAEWHPDTKDLYCIVCRDAENPTNYKVFEGPTLKNFPAFSKTISIWVGHNFIEADLDIINRRWHGLLNYERVIDTLVASRLFNFKFQGGHSVENYSERFTRKELTTQNSYGIIYPKELQKIKIEDFRVYTKDTLERCINDTLIQWFIYQYLSKWISLPSFKQALRTEHYLSSFCSVLAKNGYRFDKPKALVLQAELQSRLNELDTDLKTAFPPRTIEIGTLEPRLTKHGSIHAVDYKKLIRYKFEPEQILPGVTYKLLEVEEFNPGSIHQIIDRLWEAGWKPTEKTKGHAEFVKSREKDPDKSEKFKHYGWKLTEENLKTLPPDAPQAAQSLVERLLIASRVSDLEEWINLAVDEVSSYTGLPVSMVHGKFFHIGSWTQRMSTSNPNMQNIPVPQHKDNPSRLDILSDDISTKMRSFWIPEDPTNILVGTDADGIQMRIFAHYVNDPRLTEALIKGRKEDGTDIHSVHWKALGKACKGRQPAKTFIYAWLLGAGTAKVAEILECSFAEAKTAIDNFIQFYPGLKQLKENLIPRDAARGYFEGLDGRLVVCDSEHHMLAGYLQNGEKIVMSTAAPIWRRKLQNQGIFHIPRNFVHDEWNTETRPELADLVGKIQADAIRQAGEILNLRCPLSGDSKKGVSWLEIH